MPSPVRVQRMCRQNLSVARDTVPSMGVNHHHIIHDVDRDGWGSAALLVAELGPERCRLHPEVRKDGLAALAEVKAQTSDHVWLLDVPTPEHWTGARLPDVRITWVDHHPVRATDTPPDSVRLVLPAKSGRTTTMHLLVEHGLVPSVDRPMEFVRSLCVPGFETPWTRVIDGLCETWIAEPVPGDELPVVLAAAVRAEVVPEPLRRIEHHVEKLQRTVDEILDGCEVRRTERAVIVHLRAARGIPLKYFSLRSQRRFERPVAVLVHRDRRLYCGESATGDDEFDFLAHFQARGLVPRGHPYVAFVDVPKARIDEELAALVGALGGK